MLVVVSYVWFIYRTMELHLCTKPTPRAKIVSEQVRIGFSFCFRLVDKEGRDLFKAKKQKTPK